MSSGSDSTTADPRVARLVEDPDRDPVRLVHAVGLGAARAARQAPSRVRNLVPSPCGESRRSDAGPPDVGPSDRCGAGDPAGPGVDRQECRRSEALPGQREERTPHSCAARIMVVDDQAEVRELLREYLESEGYAVEALEDAGSALTLLPQVRPDVMLLDILMPGLSGVSALSEIRARHPDVAVIMVTAVGDQKIAQRTLALGAVDYVTKPIDFDYLKVSIESALLTRPGGFEARGEAGRVGKQPGGE